MLANKPEKVSVLQSVPIQMETDEDTRQKSGAEAGPSKPHFEPLSAYEQNGKKIEFRRVSCPAATSQRPGLCQRVASTQQCLRPC